MNHPNPISRIVNISSVLDIDRLELFDIQGRLIFSSRDMNYIDVSMYLDGVNFIKVTTAEGTNLEKNFS